MILVEQGSPTYPGRLIRALEQGSQWR